MNHKMIENQGITLIALVVTIILLLILAGVSISMLTGKNGIINMAQKAKTEYESATKKEQHQLAGAFEKNYMKYNGELHVDGTNLLNEYNEEIQLNGVVLTSPTIEKYSLETLKKVKEMGVNCIRIGLSTTANNIDEIEKMCEIIDNCIELDLYVDVIYWNSGNILQNVETANQYFSYISNKYNNTKNIIYEICNEPSVTWSDIKEYANELIPVIRKNSPNSIILVGTPYACNQLSDVIEDRLNYDNVMYVKHYYTPNEENGVYDAAKREISNAIVNGIPVFISEWSGGSSDGKKFNEDDANLLSKIIKKYNISNCYYNLNSDDNYKYCMIKDGYWSQIGNKDSLTQSGKYFYNFINNQLNLSETVEDRTIFNNGVNQKYMIWDEEIRNNVQKIEFLKSNDSIENYYKVYNMSKNGVGKIVAYVIRNENNLYDIKIISDDTIYFPAASGYFFWKFENLENIIFDNIDTSNVVATQYMFSRCSNMEELDLRAFNTENVTNMKGMFPGMSKLKSLDLSSFNMDKVDDISYMFLNDSNLSVVDFRNANFNATVYNDMFASATPQVIVKNQQTKDFILSIKSSLDVKISE